MLVPHRPNQLQVDFIFVRPELLNKRGSRLAPPPLQVVGRLASKAAASSGLPGVRGGEIVASWSTTTEPMRPML